MATASATDATFHAVQRRLAALLPDENWLESGTPLEPAAIAIQEPPRLIPASILEGKTLQQRDVPGVPAATFTAFLDGTQTSRIVAYADGVPVVHGAVASVVRERTNGRMHTWSTPRVERRLYVPERLLSAAWRANLARAGVAVTDTLEERDVESPHPFALHDAAVHAVQRDRERLERELAELWCAGAGDTAVLLVDGSISGAEAIARSECVVGVIKSHRTLYAEGDALQQVLRLCRGQRSSVCRVTSPKRSPVASWYLRLRDSAGHDPLWGLVRVEVADTTRGARALTTRADEVSRWILAEALPLAVPDARWDKMVYGVRDCEEFLRAIQ
jgi:hypothetical protein